MQRTTAGTPTGTASDPIAPVLPSTQYRLSFGQQVLRLSHDQRTPSTASAYEKTLEYG